MNTTAVRPDTDISIGGRIQTQLWSTRGIPTARSMTPNAGFYANNPQIPPFDQSEWQWAAHMWHGASLQLHVFAVFARAARAFRLGNADERVGAGGPFIFIVPTFDLKTQTSYDVEGGVRVNSGPFSLRVERLSDAAE